jgi:glutamate-1-semialdehyde 2,1-aminomutase
VFADYNDAESVTSAIRSNADDLAAVIVEPMMGGGGCIPARKDFLKLLRALTSAVGALLIFDEVMTSRLHFRGLHGALEINPDLTSLGKYLGGGASFGAFGGRADLMDRFDPTSPNAFSHGGTFNNNILSMAAGFTGLTEVLTETASRKMNDRGDRLRAGMNDALQAHDVQGIVLGRGSLMNLHFVRGPVEKPAELDRADPRLLALYHVEMLLRGFHVTPRGMLALSLPFGEAELESFIAAFDDFLITHKQILPRGFAA